MLERGGYLYGMKYGRRFQASPSFIFSAYVLDSRRRISSVSVVAAKEGNIASKVEDEAETITVGDVKSIIRNAAIDILQEDPTAERDLFALTTSQGSASFSVKRLIERLVPFSPELRGSPIYFALERKKLLSMLTNPVVTSQGSWTWFCTFASPEVYESTLYEVAEDAFIEGSLTDRIKSNVRRMKRSERLSILKESPALSARLFHYKQNSFWDLVLMGQHKPLGDISDWWRRVEVCSHQILLNTQ
jgi:hypothetical protein